MEDAYEALGRAMFVNDMIPDNDRDLPKIHTESLEETELRLLSLVRGRSLVDSSALPEHSFIAQLYSLYQKMTALRMKAVIF